MLTIRVPSSLALPSFFHFWLPLIRLQARIFVSFCSHDTWNSFNESVDSLLMELVTTHTLCQIFDSNPTISVSVVVRLSFCAMRLFWVASCYRKCSSFNWSCCFVYLPDALLWYPQFRLKINLTMTAQGLGKTKAGRIALQRHFWKHKQQQITW